MEHFYSIQGEGEFTGNPAYFIRIGGCDIGCHWCDVKLSWDATKHLIMSEENILKSVEKSKSKIVIITGGEPMIYNLDKLTSILKKSNFNVHLETSGAYEISGSWDWICLSPKRRKFPLTKNFNLAQELKIIIYNNSDFKFAEKCLLEVQTNCKLYLQPEWKMKKKMLPKIFEYVKENPKWKISLQSHKYIGVP